MSRDSTSEKRNLAAPLGEPTGGLVIAMAISSLAALIQLLPVLNGRRLSTSLLTFALSAAVSTTLLIVVRRGELLASILLPSVIIEFSLGLSVYGNHRMTVLGLLREMTLAGERGPIETYLSWWVPALLLTLLIAKGPRRSKVWWAFVGFILLILSAPLEWPPKGLFI